MNKFKFYFILLITTASIFSCQKDDDGGTTTKPPRDYQEQYNVDIAIIEEYLNSNYIDLSDPNYADKDPVIGKITDPATQPSLMSYTSNAYEGSTVFPQLWNKTVTQDGIEYKLYYLILRKGIGDSPCNVDGVFTAYEGSYLYSTVATETVPSVVNPVQFEKVVEPINFLSLFELITGWGETLPEFKKGTRTTNGDGTITFSDFGAGVMFLPSGLAYYNKAKASIPAYSPLVFSFKLYDIERLDQDSDGIPSYLEDDGDGYMRVLKADIDNPDDTDKDGLPDFYDNDDDGDNYTTRLEITKPNGSNLELDGPGLYYPFDPIISNPPKATDEKRGIPAYSETGTPDYTSTDRIRIHLDKYHHTAIPTP